MTGRLGGGHSIADQCESGAQLLLIELWSAGMPPLCAGGRHAVAGSLGDQALFELCGGAIPWSHIGITGDYLWKEIDRPSNASVLFVPTTSIQKVLSFFSGYYGTKDLGARSRTTVPLPYAGQWTSSGQRCWRTRAKHLAASISAKRLTRSGAAIFKGPHARWPARAALADYHRGPAGTLPGAVAEVVEMEG